VFMDISLMTMFKCVAFTGAILQPTNAFVFKWGPATISKPFPATRCSSLTTKSSTGRTEPFFFPLTVARLTRLQNTIVDMGVISDVEVGNKSPHFPLSPDFNVLCAKDRMKKTIESTITNLGSIRAGRAQPSMLDRVFVDYFGTPTPLQQLATVMLQGSSSLVISPFDKTTLKDIERAIVESDVGMTPSNDGEKIRLNVPALTQERRRDLAKTCKSLGEEGMTTSDQTLHSFNYFCDV
jgi:hypothetical protein